MWRPLHSCFCRKPAAEWPFLKPHFLQFFSKKNHAFCMKLLIFLGPLMRFARFWKWGFSIITYIFHFFSRFHVELSFWRTSQAFCPFLRTRCQSGDQNRCIFPLFFRFKNWHSVWEVLRKSCFLRLLFLLKFLKKKSITFWGPIRRNGRFWLIEIDFFFKKAGFFSQFWLLFWSNFDDVFVSISTFFLGGQNRILGPQKGRLWVPKMVA